MFIKIFLMVIAIPILMGNERCQLGDVVEDMMDQVFYKKRKILLTGQSIYVSHLTMIDGETNYSFFNSDSIKIINAAVIRGIHLAQKKYNFIKHNAPGHTLRDTEDNTTTLKDIILNKNLTKDKKMDRIIKELMQPANIDIIVSGVYFEKGNTIMIQPFIVNRSERKLVTKRASFLINQLVCSDPMNKGSNVLCRGAYEEIAKLVEELFEGL